MRGDCAAPPPRLLSVATGALCTQQELGHVGSEDCLSSLQTDPMLWGSGDSAQETQETAPAGIEITKAAVSERIKTVVLASTDVNSCSWNFVQQKVLEGCTESEQTAYADVMREHKTFFKEKARTYIDQQEHGSDSTTLPTTPPSSPRSSSYQVDTPSRGHKPAQALRSLKDMQESSSYMRSMGGRIPPDLPSDWWPIMYDLSRMHVHVCETAHAFHCERDYVKFTPWDCL